MIPGLVLAAPASGSGKTTVVCALAAALRRRGQDVRLYKAGPDYLDPGWHQRASGRASRNLDVWMTGVEGARQGYARGAVGGDLGLVEGVMGLYDGRTPTGLEGSTAELAMALGLPVVLVVDASGLARTAVALVAGLAGHVPQVGVVGVIFNRVGSAGHARILDEAMTLLPDVVCLGALPRAAEIALPERHLGLVSAEEGGPEGWAEKLADLAEQHLRLDRLVSLARVGPGQEEVKTPRKGPSSGSAGLTTETRRHGGSARSGAVPPRGAEAAPEGRIGGFAYRQKPIRRGADLRPAPTSGRVGSPCLRVSVVVPAFSSAQAPLPEETTNACMRMRAPPPPTVRIGYALDRAFHFYYADNLDLLREAGAELVPFSPLTDAQLPPNLSGLYLGGGYPELHAETLSCNTTLRAEIQQFAGPIYAECGGLMYLGEALDGWPMCGALPVRTRLGPRLRALGYREVTTTRDTILGPAGTVFRGHEFHYSDLDGAPPLTPAYQMSGRTGPSVEGWGVGLRLGSYVHAHFGSNPALARRLVAACAQGRP